MLSLMIGFHMLRITSIEAIADPIRRGSHHEASVRIPQAVSANPISTNRERMPTALPARPLARQGSCADEFRAELDPLSPALVVSKC